MSSGCSSSFIQTIRIQGSITFNFSGEQSTKKGKSEEPDKDDQVIKEMLKDITDLFLVPGEIVSIKYKGNFRPKYFPVHGLLNRRDEVRQVFFKNMNGLGGLFPDHFLAFKTIFRFRIYVHRVLHYENYLLFWKLLINQKLQVEFSGETNLLRMIR